MGITLYLRCQAILDIERAQTEAGALPQCQREQREAGAASGPSGHQTQRCTAAVAGAYAGRLPALYRRRQLNPGGAVDYFQAFIEGYPHCRSARDRMLAIDRLIHSFHYSLRQDPTLPTRPAAVNLIEGRLGDIVPFLDELTYGSDSPYLAETRRAWGRPSLGARVRHLGAVRRARRGSR